MDVIVQSKRDQRTLEWLIEQAGRDAVERACSELLHGRRPYVSNIAKALGLQPPQSLQLSTKADALQHLARIRELLQRRDE